jgi:Cd2+/Zn2+-exporting ATPase
LTRAGGAVALGAVLRVRPGERVPMDGVLTAGSTSINQAPVTGESIPVDKGWATRCSPARSTRPAASSSRHGAGLELDAGAHHPRGREAQGTRAPTQGFVDRFAAVYTPAVFVDRAGGGLLGPGCWTGPGCKAIYKALVLLVIACPCALVISTPVTIVSGLARRPGAAS